MKKLELPSVSPLPPVSATTTGADDSVRRDSRLCFANGGGWCIGLIFTISKAELPIIALQRLRPGHMGLIASEQSRSQAEAIRREAGTMGIFCHGIVRVDNPDDPAETRECTRALLNRMWASGAARCAVDVTDGKTPMSLGAFMVAEETGVSTLYLASRYDDKPQRPDPLSSRIHCISRPE